jgi:hypothetical protein
MKRLLVALIAIGILALSSCASSRPCPAYANALDTKEIRG